MEDKDQGREIERRIELEVAQTLSNTPDLATSDEQDKFWNIRQKLIKFDRERYEADANKLGEFLNNFVDLQKRKETQKLWFKRIFFAVIMFLFIALFLMPIILLFYFQDLITNISILVTILTSFVELTSAIIVLPKIIGEYLFNKGEEESVYRILEKMQEINELKHDHIEKVE